MTNLNLVPNWREEKKGEHWREAQVESSLMQVKLLIIFSSKLKRLGLLSGSASEKRRENFQNYRMIN